MKNEIYRPIAQQEKDKQVMDFGGYEHSELRLPLKRQERQDVFLREAQKRLPESAVNRALFFAYGIGNLPAVHFPNGEHIQHIPYRKKDWQNYGNVESEYTRIHFMLDNYPSREFPIQFYPFCKNALNSPNILLEWGRSSEQRGNVSASIYQNVLLKMYARREKEPLEYHNGTQGAYQASPIFYESSEVVRNAQKQLWLKGLAQLAKELQGNNYHNVASFLELYNRVKDPLTPVVSNLDQQVQKFLSLYTSAIASIPAAERSLQKDHILIAQLALEASFLALPAAQDIMAVVYGHHHELPYYYVEVDKLPRGEFANPKRVGEVLEDIVKDARKYQQPIVTPIMVAYYQEPKKNKPELCILDGNNRATALLLMQYLDACNFNKEKILSKDSLHAFVSKKKLDIAWERDLVMALKALSQQQEEIILQNKDMIRRFAHAQIPALLVQEANFHTVAVALSSKDAITLLQPMHQAIYNQRTYPLAIPSKQQSHGRSEGNDIRISVKE